MNEKREKEDTVYVCIVSYRDPDLKNTIKNCLDNAKKPESIFFSVLSQAEDNEHPDLSFVPDSQIRYLRRHHSESRGPQWARAMATEGQMYQKYFLQVDSHSRFKPNWDELIIKNFESASEFWGNRIIITNYPDHFSPGEGEDVYYDTEAIKKFYPMWSEVDNTIMANHDWPDIVDVKNGDEVFFLSLNSMFTTTDIMQSIPFDSELYFTGDEGTMALRAYTNGIRLISPIVKYMYTNGDRANPPRPLHYLESSRALDLNILAYKRMSKLYRNEPGLGIYGIGSTQLYEQYQKITGIYFDSEKMEPPFVG